MTGNLDQNFAKVISEARLCTKCADFLPNPPKPILRGLPSAKLLIVGQAPGRRVHETGIPWNDPSGDRLRLWLGMGREEFYDETRIAIIPAGLCYPGTKNGGDLPPRPECAPFWHPRLRAVFTQIQLTLLIGRHAQAYYLGCMAKPSLAETVQSAHEYLPAFLPLPHPSPRNVRWFKTHPWFDREIVPELRKRVRAVLDGPAAH
jgi:uracil-DNA glycosylase